MTAPARSGQAGTSLAPSNLGDILERVLDKGIVIAGDISVAVGGVELLSIKIRLIIASVERARRWVSTGGILIQAFPAAGAARAVRSRTRTSSSNLNSRTRI